MFLVDVNSTEDEMLKTVTQNISITGVDDWSRMSSSADERTWGWWLLQIGTPLITLVGITGNILAFIVLKSRRFRGKSYSHFLCTLTIFDSLVLVGKYCNRLDILLTNVGREGLFVSYGSAMCKMHNFVEHVCYLMSGWLVLCMTLERFIAVKFPFRKDVLCRPRNAVTVIIVVFAVLSYSQIFRLVIVESEDGEGAAGTRGLEGEATAGTRGLDGEGTGGSRGLDGSVRRTKAEGEACGASERYRNVYLILHIYFYQVGLQFLLPAAVIIACNMSILAEIRNIRRRPDIVRRLNLTRSRSAMERLLITEHHHQPLPHPPIPPPPSQSRGADRGDNETGGRQSSSGGRRTGSGTRLPDEVVELAMISTAGGGRRGPAAASGSTTRPAGLAHMMTPSTVQTPHRPVRRSEPAPLRLPLRDVTAMSSQRRRRPAGHHHTTTCMLLIVSFWYVVCLLPLVLLSLIMHFLLMTGHTAQAQFLYGHLHDVGQLFEFISELNYASNFYIYVLSGAQFRTALRHCCSAVAASSYGRGAVKFPHTGVVAALAGRYIPANRAPVAVPAGSRMGERVRVVESGGGLKPGGAGTTGSGGRSFGVAGERVYQFKKFANSN